MMDVGRSLNPSVDIGQIEGAFMQGVGLFTMEEELYTKNGVLLTRGPGAYKIPGFRDIPRSRLNLYYRIRYTVVLKPRYWVIQSW